MKRGKKGGGKEKRGKEIKRIEREGEGKKRNAN